VNDITLLLAGTTEHRDQLSLYTNARIADGSAAAILGLLRNML